MDSGKVLLAGLAGVAAGAVLGILFAPEKGSRTRKQILNRGTDYADDIKEKFEDIIDSITQKYETAMHDAEEVVEKGKTKYNDAKREVHNATV
jgi:gas vesicle protein